MVNDKIIQRSSFRNLASLVLTSVMFFSSFGAFAQDGEKLFKQNCAACHVPTDKTVVGPGLKGISERTPSEKWIIDWVKNPDALIASGDAYANKIKDFSPTAMTAFGFLSDEEIVSIIGYINSYAPPVEAAPVAAEGTAEVSTSGTLDEGTLRNVLIGVGGLLLVLVFILSSVRRSLTQLVSEKEGVEVPEELGTWGSITHWMGTHRGWTGVFLLVSTLIFLQWGVKELMNIGVYEGYKPTQPIAFSHKIHAGQNGINCVYCHTSAEKGKTAGIPSLNVCMNCHSYVSEGPSGTTEIAKIYAALDYDPATKKYGGNPTPVEWVRVHNLPDLSYFNHSQHVVVGKIECQQCHGAVEEMGVAEQHSPLTMGWCVECHRTTSVQVADNAYYEDLHERTPSWHDGNPVTVEKIGGLECAKCHY
ncbi:MAG: c-type cytochrome [Flavobacteriales bacterium]|nr:c-type cytochrome [Flavobacteriales bacterium]